MTRKLSLVYTLALLAAFCTVFVPAVEANNLNTHARMIKKRAGLDDIVPIKPIAAPSIPVIGAGANPNDPTDDPTAGNTPAASGSQSAAQNSASNTASATNSASGGLLPTLSLPILGSASQSSASSTSSSSSSSSSASSSTASSSSSAPPSVTQQAQPSSSDSTFLLTITSSPTANPSSAAPSNTGTSGAAGDNGGGHLTRNTIIAIVVVAACVGGAVIIWTVIRKWKFAPSEEFGDRLNPIDWRPTSEKDNEKFADIDGTGVGHRRRGSGGSNRSFVSADAHSQSSGHGAVGGVAPNYLNNGNGNNMIPDLPQHDFTAGTTANGGLAPVGGYADLRRGPSPTPSMGDHYYRGYGATAQYGSNGY